MVLKVGTFSKDWKESWDFKKINRLMERDNLRYMTEVPDTGSDADILLLSNKELTQPQAQRLFDASHFFIDERFWKGKDFKDLVDKVKTYGKKRLKEIE